MRRTLLYGLFFFTCFVLSVNAFRSILNSYAVGSVYLQRKKDTERQYLEVVQKKNELDYINSPFFVEKQLRESLNYYRKGEKLIVFTHPVAPTPPSLTTTSTPEQTPWQQWLTLLSQGIRAPYEQ